MNAESDPSRWSASAQREEVSPSFNSRPTSKPADSQTSVQELLDQLVDEFVHLSRCGRSPAIEDFQQRYPDLAEEIADVLGSAAMIEDLKKQTGAIGTRPESSFEKLTIERLGDYRILREVGRGGMGIVVEAVHESLGRTVAIKVLPSRMFNDANAVRRFQKEAQAAANLHHSNIVNVFGVGECEGWHYYVMEFVDGCSFADVIEKLRRHSSTQRTKSPVVTRAIESASSDVRCEEEARKETVVSQSIDRSSSVSGDNVPALPVTSNSDFLPSFASSADRIRWSTQVVIPICDALNYSHEMRMLHRDIKPGNLLIDRNGKPWITDFGLVKEITNQTLTLTGDLFGTPQYMAPESLRGRYDARSEVYCLGLTLYELLALEPAFSAESPTRLLKLIGTTDPVPLRQLNSQIPTDLETIVHKALDREPERRYATAADLRDDLQRFLDDRPILARPVSMIEKSVRWARRNPLPASLASLSAAMLLLVTVISSVAWFMTQGALDRLEQKHAELTQQQAATLAAEQQARDNASRMREQFDRAEANVDLTMAAFDKIFRQVMSRGAGRDLKSNLALEDFAELSALETKVTAEDAKILQSVVSFYEKFADRNEGSDRLQLEIARALRRVANIYHLTGEFSSAQRAYRKAVEAYRQSLEKNPSKATVAVSLAETYNELAIAYRKSNRIPNAIAEHRNAIDLLREDALVDCDDCQFTLAQSLNHLCTIGPTAGNGRRSARSKGPGPGRPPERFKRLRSDGFLNAGRLQFLRQAMEISERLLKQDPKNPEYRLLRAKIYRSKALIWGVNGELRWETNQLQRAIKEMDNLVKDYPDNPIYRFAMANLLSVPVHNAETEIQIRMRERSLALSSSLVSEYPQVLEYVELNAQVSRQLGTLYRGTSLEKAEEHLRIAESQLLRLIGQVPNVQAYYLQYAEVCTQLIEVLMQQSSWDSAEKEIKQLNEFVQNLPLLNRLRFKRGEILSSNRQRLQKVRAELRN